MNKGLAYVDGEYCAPDQAKISVFDPGFTHSDAVYDVTSTWKGYFFRLDDHIDRFLRSCVGVNIVCPYGPGKIKEILATCVLEGGVEAGSYVAVVATRGRYAPEAESSRDIFRTSPTLIAYAVPYLSIATEEQQANGMNLIVSRTPRIPDKCVDMRFKNYHWGDLTRGKFEARDAGADGAIHPSIDGYLTEGAGFNFFFARSGRLFTPGRNILHGITRQTVLDLARELGIPAEIGDYRLEEVREADEAFITSTAGGIMPVRCFDGKALRSADAGSLCFRFRDEYWRRRESGWLGTRVSAVSAARP